MITSSCCSAGQTSQETPSVSSSSASSQTSEQTTASGPTEVTEQSGELPALGTQAPASCWKGDGWKTEGGKDPVDEVLDGSLDGGLEDA